MTNFVTLVLLHFFFRVHFSSLVKKNIYISLYTYLKISSKMFLYVHFVIQKYSIRNCIRCTSLYVLYYTYKYNLFYITHILICTILCTEIFDEIILSIWMICVCLRHLSSVPHIIFWKCRVNDFSLSYIYFIFTAYITTIFYNINIHQKFTGITSRYKVFRWWCTKNMSFCPENAIDSNTYSI